MSNSFGRFDMKMSEILRLRILTEKISKNVRWDETFINEFEFIEVTAFRLHNFHITKKKQLAVTQSKLHILKLLSNCFLLLRNAK